MPGNHNLQREKKTDLFDEEVEEKYCFLHPLALDFSRTQTRAEKIFCSTMKQEHNLASRPHSLTMSHGIAAAAAAMLKNRKISKMQRKFTKSSEFCYVPVVVVIFSFLVICLCLWLHWELIFRR